MAKTKSDRQNPMKRMMLLLVLGLATASLFAQSTMKAIVVHQFGGPEVLKYEDAPRPQPKENEILVRVIAAGVNPADTYVRSGKFGSAATLPLVPGWDIAGIVEELASGATRFKKG